jgi:hypothetical protein
MNEWVFKTRVNGNIDCVEFIKKIFNIGHRRKHMLINNIK